MEYILDYKNVERARKVYTDISFEHWYKDDLFSPQWWFLLISTLALIIIFWIFIEKKRERFLEIFSYGLLCSVFASVLDTAGVEFMLWGYPDKLVNMVPPLIPADVVVIPISAMFLYQFCKTRIKFVLGSVILAAVYSYILEPLFIKFSLFELNHWKHTYSFIGFILFFITIKELLKVILQRLK
ncbi:hypothetical protein JOC77_004361 [Peribacillus deserti]|uniref:Permease n=1 Tax=Peribacillus deserti TaxID=673318 RepID=A0ABS2QNY1_9BACI|nr:CBO0543 family protein [Peribacillus deserti]MBM7694882.1 hypothetical protein [Peribacillus deserti]